MSGSRRRVVALIAKDLRIHGRAIAATQAAVLALGAVAWSVKPEAYAANAALMVNFNVLLAGFWSEWLISREKTKGTFAWLRETTVTDTELVLSKFLGTGLCAMSLWIATAVLFVRPDAAAGAVAGAGLLAFSALAIASRWRFGAKFGQMLPYAVLLVPLLAMIGLGRAMGAEIDVAAWLDRPSRRAGALVLFLACWATLFAAVRRWVRGCDTFELLE